MEILDKIKAEVSKELDDRVEKINEKYLKKLEEINEQYLKKLEETAPRLLEITLDKRKFVTKKAEYYHEEFQKVLNCVHLDMPVFLTGDAGSGKTTIAEQCARALKLPYYCISVCLQTSETSFLGYRDAHGNYVRTLFREAYEKGGLFLIDEIDNGNPNVISVLNAALANGICAFPDGMIKKHKNFRLIASGNTVGRGASREYVGRLEMDLATLDRFVVIVIDYDETIERNFGYKAVVDMVQQIRKIVADKSIRLVISPRATINITKIVKSDFKIKIKDILDICIYKGCDESIIKQIEQSLYSHHTDDIKALVKSPRKTKLRKSLIKQESEISLF